MSDQEEQEPEGLTRYVYERPAIVVATALTHPNTEFWCKHAEADQALAAKDARIAELEAALGEKQADPPVGRAEPLQDKADTYWDCLSRVMSMGHSEDWAMRFRDWKQITYVALAAMHARLDARGDEGEG